MKILIDISDEEIEYIKKISLGQSVETYIKAYLDFNLFNKNNSENIKNIIDEFDKLEQDFEFYKISQYTLAAYLNTTQPTVSRFMKNKSKRSFLYNEIFLKYKSTDDFIFDLYFSSRSDIFDIIFSDLAKKWINDIIPEKLYIEKIIKSLILAVYEIKYKELHTIYYKNIEISDSLKKNILSLLNNIEEFFPKDKYNEKNIEHFYELELKYKTDLVIDEIF